MFFTKYNNETKRYGVLPKQLFCFPSNTGEVDATSTTSYDSLEKSNNQSDITQQRAFKHAEVLLLDLYSFLKASYSRTNCQPYSNGNDSSDDSNSVLSKIDRQKLNDMNINDVSDGNINVNTNININADSNSNSNSYGSNTGQEESQSADDKTQTQTEIETETVTQASDLVMADLFTLLKMSGRRDVAVVFESTIWHSWMAHHDPQVNKAMRLGISNLVRNDVIAAHDNFMEATLRDPFYPEAHNKLAAMYHKAGKLLHL